jgi:hypothetical protein
MLVIQRPRTFASAHKVSLRASIFETETEDIIYLYIYIYMSLTETSCALNSSASGIRSNSYTRVVTFINRKSHTEFRPCRMTAIHPDEHHCTSHSSDIMGV